MDVGALLTTMALLTGLTDGTRFGRWFVESFTAQGTYAVIGGLLILLFALLRAT